MWANYMMHRVDVMSSALSSHKYCLRDLSCVANVVDFVVFVNDQFVTRFVPCPHDWTKCYHSAVHYAVNQTFVL